MCMYVCMYVCTYAYRSEHNLKELLFTFYLVSFRVQTQVTRLVSNHLYLLSHLTISRLFIGARMSDLVEYSLGQ